MTLTLSTLKIPVGDLARSVAFYEAALGLKSLFVSEEFGWAQMDGADIPLALYVPGKGGGESPLGRGLDFQLAHDDLDALAETVRSVAPGAKIFTNADGSRSLEFTDPDGNLIKIMGV